MNESEILFVKGVGGRDRTSLSIRIRRGFAKNILFIHGLGCSKDYFQGAWQAHSLSEYSLFAPDLPGFGDSPYITRTPYSIEDYSKLLEELLRELYLDKVHLVCHSMGGAIGILLAEALGEQVLTFSNLEGNLIPEDCFVSRKLIKNKEARNFKRADVEEIANKLEELNLLFEAEQFRRSHPRALYEVSQSLVEVSDHGNLLSRFSQLGTPCLYFYGSKNQDTPIVRDLQRRSFPTSCVERAGHSMMIDNPKSFYPLLAHFLEHMTTGQEQQVERGTLVCEKI